jgi:hypothetical protein
MIPARMPVPSIPPVISPTMRSAMASALKARTASER